MLWAVAGLATMLCLAQEEPARLLLKLSPAPALTVDPEGAPRIQTGAAVESPEARVKKPLLVCYLLIEQKDGRRQVRNSQSSLPFVRSGAHFVVPTDLVRFSQAQPEVDKAGLAKLEWHDSPDTVNKENKLIGWRVELWCNGTLHDAFDSLATNPVSRAGSTTNWWVPVKEPEPADDEVEP